MQFLELKQKLSDQIVFTSNDIRKIDPAFYLSRLTEWQKKGYIKKIIKGHYIFTDTEIDEIVLFSIANRIYPSSYISLESSFRYYNIIPEGVFSITSVTARNTYRFSTDMGEFKYQKLMPSLFFGYNIISRGKIKVKIAFLEKAMLDYFYLHPEISDKESIDGLRLNLDILSKDLDQKKMMDYLSSFNNKSLERRINLLIEIINDN